jgi:hypothetical protein
MSIIALALVAGLTHAAPGDRFAVAPGDNMPLVAANAKSSACPNAFQQLQKAHEQQLSAGLPRAKASKLGDLPKANLTLTVLRAVDGCAISSTVRYEVEGDGRAGR